MERESGKNGGRERWKVKEKRGLEREGERKERRGKWAVGPKVESCRKEVPLLSVAAAAGT